MEDGRMVTSRRLSFLVAAFCLVSCAHLSSPDADALKSHPRLYADREAWDRLRQRIKNPGPGDADLLKRYRKLQSIAEKTYFKNPRSEGDIPALQVSYTSDDMIPT